MIALPLNTDPGYIEPQVVGRMDRFFLRLINDKRDLPFVHLIRKVSFSIVPLAVLLFLPFVTGWAWIAIAAVYLFVNNVTYKGPFGLMLHCSSHRPLFRTQYGALNYLIPWVLAPFFGQSPETYFAHHIGMHHVENNMEEDESSTMPYQRDSGAHFTRYFLTFLFTGIYTLAVYHFTKRSKKLGWRTVRGEMLFIAFCTALCFVNWQATLVVFILPFLAFRLVAMAGNWVQHTFICPEQPANDYRNSITCINVKFNHKCWNDGYHISHHINPTLHWTEHPTYFREHLDEFAQNRSVVFAGLNFLDIFILLMRKRYDTLADHFVNVGGVFKDDAEVIAHLRHRMAPVPFPKAEGVALAA
ncbi:MAG TPA: fatty acid desaturase [Flavobacteriales bacterium]|nr:MAG: fatty acid desaturase [Flavobacteriales bacterium]HQV40028.1 fatty acid desaturase [Flavobacteriales bacterium]HQW32151.1 fatty acid desaturase [Flavobacteriales bacterium]HQY01769.1 fatty acid desaturase [Flavobacteriales bacterium]HQY78473.1 fatty acid desaturase [Flavobacteriales bacterium]